jgi:hypothetical protein
MLESRALPGAVAQLGERRVRNAKVEGSIPFRSTSFRADRSSTYPSALMTLSTVRVGDSRDLVIWLAASTRFSISGAL